MKGRELLLDATEGNTQCRLFGRVLVCDHLREVKPPSKNATYQHLCAGVRFSQVRRRGYLLMKETDPYSTPLPLSASSSGIAGTRSV